MKWMKYDSAQWLAGLQVPVVFLKVKIKVFN